MGPVYNQLDGAVISEPVGVAARPAFVAYRPGPFPRPYSLRPGRG